MLGGLERFQISGLHGRRNIDVPIQGNTLVLVGENGSGKTTFLRVLFLFLSGKWLSLSSFQFDSISATIGGDKYGVSRKEIIDAFKGIDPGLFAGMLSSVRRRGMRHLEIADMEQVELEFGRGHGKDGYFNSEEFIVHHGKVTKGVQGRNRGKLVENISKIRKAIHAQILYLPTYRRIERELSSIFEDVDSDDLRRHHRNRIRQDDLGEAYIELVEFGMNDVQRAIDRALEKLKEFARENLNDLTLKYLGDVVSREHQTVGVKEISDISEDTVKSVLNRIQESILTETHKKKIIDVINSVRVDGTESEHKKIIIHYFMKLLRFQQSLQENEQQISAFCDLCSEYITDKRFVYNSRTFSFSIIPKEESDGASVVKLSDLSSGEKQIVSLFSHLYLSGRKDFFVLIDEPELSLSVPWQRRFLKDIHDGHFCKGLVAVTHSPFIYDNDLRQYAHSLGEFVGL